MRLLISWQEISVIKDWNKQESYRRRSNCISAITGCQFAATCYRLDWIYWCWTNQCTLTLQMDNGPEFEPSFTWQNPGTTHPAILRVELSELPGDGSIHAITVR